MVMMATRRRRRSNFSYCVVRETIPLLLLLLLQQQFCVQAAASFLMTAAPASTPAARQKPSRGDHCGFKSSSALKANAANDIDRFQEVEGRRRRRREQGVDQKQPQPPYKIASADLSGQWIKLVEDGKVSASINGVRYGVKFVDGSGDHCCQDYIDENSTEDPTILEMSKQLGLRYATDDDEGVYYAQLQLVRTLRPPASPGFGSTSSVPPEYDASTDSFVEGPLRLQLRPRVSTLPPPDDGAENKKNKSRLRTPWDVYHNVSPADPRGHFLLLPTLDDSERNWRGQSLVADDCHDLVHLSSTIEPVGSLLVAYNSVGAGASQNHVHCHAWPYPPMPLLNDRSEYAVFRALAKDGCCFRAYRGVSIWLLDYPVFCLKLSAGCDHLDELGQALAVTLDAIDDAPLNVGFMNRYGCGGDVDGSHGAKGDQDTVAVDVFVFVRSKERPTHAPALKLGASEMMGLFHAQSEDELQLLARGDTMRKALDDISVVDEATVWERIKESCS